MAGDNDGDWISTIGCTDRPRRARFAHHGGLFGIRSGLAIGNLKERRPRALLEWRSSKGLDWHRKNVQSPREVGVEFGFGEIQDRVIIGFDPCLLHRRHVLAMEQVHIR
mgnify:CR=1 FL=1